MVTIEGPDTVTAGQPATYTVKVEFSGAINNEAPSTLTVRIWEDDDILVDPDELLHEKVTVVIPQRQKSGEGTFTLECVATTGLFGLTDRLELRGDPGTTPGRDSEAFSSYEIYAEVVEQPGIIVSRESSNRPVTCQSAVESEDE